MPILSIIQRQTGMDGFQRCNSKGSHNQSSFSNQMLWNTRPMPQELRTGKKWRFSFLLWTMHQVWFPWNVFGALVKYTYRQNTRWLLNQLLLTQVNQTISQYFQEVGMYQEFDGTDNNWINEEIAIIVTWVYSLCHIRTSRRRGIQDEKLSLHPNDTASCQKII